MLLVNELFSGIGTQALALEYSNIPHKVVGTAEIEKNAINVYNALHGETPNYGDISKIDRLDYADLWTYSFPCFTGDTLVLTNSGYKKMIDVTTEDEVYTHKGRFKPILKKFDNGVHEIWTVKTANVDVIRTTENHRFYVVTRNKKWNKELKKNDYVYSEPYWKECYQLTKKDYVLSPTYTIENDIKYKEHKTIDRMGRLFIANQLKDKITFPLFYWVLGKYIGDGWLRSASSGIVICCSKKNNESIELETNLNKLGFNFSKVEERTVFKYHICSVELYEYCKEFNNKAVNKRLPPEIINLNIECLKEFIKGYLCVDGCKIGNTYKITSISRELLYGVGMCITKCYNVPFKLYKNEMPKTTVIEGRVVNQNDFYQLVFDLRDTVKRSSCVYLHDNYWYAVKEVKNTGEEELVYDIEVEDDNSLVVQGLSAHNCQDLSSGGKGKGVDAVDSDGKPIQTRSGLLWEVERLLERACGYKRVDGELVKDEDIDVNSLTSPKFLVLENVPELVKTKKHYVNFLKWTEKLELLGYTSSHCILNGADFGVPQNRERVFCVSIRRDILNNPNDSFEFPNVSRDSIVIAGTGQCRPNNVKIDDFVEDSVMAYNGPLMIDPAISNYLLPAYTRDIEAISKSDKPIWTCKCKSGFQDHRVGIDYSPTIRHQNSHTAVFVNNQIHKLTGLESWRFMGIKDKDFYKAKELGLSDNILIGLAGNAIVVPILQMLFKQLNYINEHGEQNITTLSTFV